MMCGSEGLAIFQFSSVCEDGNISYGLGHGERGGGTRWGLGQEIDRHLVGCVSETAIAKALYYDRRSC